jgi:hypothetical protein
MASTLLSHLTDTIDLKPGIYYHELKLLMPNDGEAMSCSGAMC